MRIEFKGALFAGACVLILGTSGLAEASDLMRRVPVAAPLSAAETVMIHSNPVHNWSGLYGGVFVEYGTGPDTVGIQAPNVDIGKANVNGFGGGVDIGYNYQNGHFVLGLEADALFSGMKDSLRNAAIFGGSVATAKYDWLVTLRPRVGYAFDNVLIYGTAGLAIGGIDYSVAAAAPAGAFSAHSTRVGFAAGGGVEYAFTNNISLRGEYLLSKLETKTYTFLPAYRTQSIGLAHHFRVGLNYRF